MGRADEGGRGRTEGARESPTEGRPYPMPSRYAWCKVAVALRGTMAPWLFAAAMVADTLLLTALGGRRRRREPPDGEPIAARGNSGVVADALQLRFEEPGDE